MQIEATELPGVLLIQPVVHGDHRGFFLESWSGQRYEQAGLPVQFVQDNLSFSGRGVLRGLHFQYPQPQGKLVTVLQGEVFDVAVDIRRGSPHFGKWVARILSGENKHQLYVPEGFAHGFCVLSETALFAYKCTDYYAPQFETSIRWDDPQIGISWPVDDPKISGKDQQGVFLADLPPDKLPPYTPTGTAHRVSSFVASEGQGSATRPARQSASPARAASRPAERRILLVGAQGQVGSELRRSLQTMGSVVPASRRPHPADPRGVAVDLEDVRQLRQLVKDVRPHLIVNAAAYTAVDRAEQESARAAAINADAVAVLGEEARQCGAAVVHYSTDYVFDGRGCKPRREDEHAAPVNVYGRTKLEGEWALQASGAAHLILRVSWVYHQRGQNFLRTMLRLGQERQSLSIVDDQVGAPTSARVIADMTSRILAGAGGDFHEFLAEQGGTYHAVCRGWTSWYGFAQTIFDTARRCGVALQVEQLEAIPTSHYPTPARRPHNSRLDCTKVQQQFGLRLPEWKDALYETMAEWLAEQRSGDGVPRARAA